MQPDLSADAPEFESDALLETVRRYAAVTSDDHAVPIEQEALDLVANPATDINKVTNSLPIFFRLLVVMPESVVRAALQRPDLDWNQTGVALSKKGPLIHNALTYLAAHTFNNWPKAISQSSPSLELQDRAFAFCALMNQPKMNVWFGAAQQEHMAPMAVDLSRGGVFHSYLSRLHAERAQLFAAKILPPEAFITLGGQLHAAAHELTNPLPRGVVMSSSMKAAFSASLHHMLGAQVRRVGAMDFGGPLGANKLGNLDPAPFREAADVKLFEEEVRKTPHLLLKAVWMQALSQAVAENSVTDTPASRLKARGQEILRGLALKAG